MFVTNKDRFEGKIRAKRFERHSPLLNKKNLDEYLVA